LCNDEQKAEIEKFQAIPIEELKATVAERTAAAEAAEKTFKDEVAKLQSKYESLMKEKDEAVAAAAVPSVVRSVIAASKKGGDDADAKDEL
jgi:C4-dicarboxylate-specific signal transduction histidine kinase